MSVKILKKSVPFITQPHMSSENKVVLLDRVELPFTAFNSKNIHVKTRCNLSLSEGVFIPAEQAISLVRAQLDVGLEIAFSNSYWREIRDGDPNRAILAYILETCQYLDAAPYRMARGIGRTLLQNPVIDNIAEHMVEEADHKIYFAKALNKMGCPNQLIDACYPMPMTLEWIYLMRAVSGLDPLSAAICSGLMEHSTQHRSSVEAWHKMLVEKGILSNASVDAMFEHIKVDMALGHGTNWQTILEMEEHIDPRRLVQALNAVTLVAEMLDRWSEGLRTGLSKDIVAMMPDLANASSSRDIHRDIFADGLPLLPSDLIHKAMHGGISQKGARKVVALAVGYRGMVQPTNAMARSMRELLKKSNELVALTRCHTVSKIESADQLIDVIKGWMCTVDGHALWREMINEPDYHLTLGWLLENYHYIGFIAQHNGVAISACTDMEVRKHLIHHLAEEFNHATILAKALEQTPYENILLARPLPTTIAFLGALADLAQQNWKAYCVALSYLQLTLSSDNNLKKHHDFYDTLIQKVPRAASLLNSMRKYDGIDKQLGHENDIFNLLKALAERHEIDRDMLSAAAIIPQLLWSFLDGIRCHYKNGEVSIVTRMGWHVYS